MRYRKRHQNTTTAMVSARTGRAIAMAIVDGKGHLGWLCKLQGAMSAAADDSRKRRRTWLRVRACSRSRAQRPACQCGSWLEEHVEEDDFPGPAKGLRWFLLASGCALSGA